MSESRSGPDDDRAATATRAAAATAPAAVRVFRRQAIERYLEPAAERPAQPAALPGGFAALWWLVAALVAAGLLVGWTLAADLGYVGGGEDAGAAPSAAATARGDPGG